MKPYQRKNKVIPLKLMPNNMNSAINNYAIQNLVINNVKSITNYSSYLRLCVPLIYNNRYNNNLYSPNVPICSVISFNNSNNRRHFLFYNTN